MFFFIKPYYLYISKRSKNKHAQSLYLSDYYWEIKLIAEDVVGVDEINLIGYILNVLIDANEHI